MLEAVSGELFDVGPMFELDDVVCARTIELEFELEEVLLKVLELVVAWDELFTKVDDDELTTAELEDGPELVVTGDELLIGVDEFATEVLENETELVVAWNELLATVADDEDEFMAERFRTDPELVASDDKLLTELLVAWKELSADIDDDDDEVMTELFKAGTGLAAAWDEFVKAVDELMTEEPIAELVLVTAGDELFAGIDDADDEVMTKEEVEPELVEA